MKAVPGKINFHLEFSFSFRQRTAVKEVIRHIFTQENKPLVSLDYIFCSDTYLLGLNQQYLKHDTLTDIITFDLSASSEGIMGEIYISVERVRENAISFGVSFDPELRRVMIHGALHLCGYADKKTDDKEEMTKKENQYLMLF